LIPAPARLCSESWWTRGARIRRSWLRGAITDASAWLIQNRLSVSQREALLQELFGPSPGLGLSFTRLTMGASDFSPHQYSYDDMPRPDRFSAGALFHRFNRAYVLPVVQRALAINPRLKIMASPWSPRAG